MSDTTPEKTSLSLDRTDLGHLFRRLRATLGLIEDFDAFTGKLESLLREIPELQNIILEPMVGNQDRNALAARVKDRQLMLPLTAPSGFLGTLTLPDNRRSRRMGSQDLHLLSALAGLSATLLDISKRVGDAARWERMMDQIFDSIPVGMVIQPGPMQDIRLNRTAEKMLQSRPGEPSPHLDILLEAAKKGTRHFHLKVGDSLYFTRLFQYPEEAQKPTCRLTLLYDLTRERNRIHEFLARETYRCQWQQRPLSILLLQSPTAEEKLHSRLTEIEEAIIPGGMAGPADAQTIALIFPGTSLGEARRWMRDHQSLLPPTQLNIGSAHIADAPVEGAALMEAAYQSLQSRHHFLRPTLLLADAYEPVNDTLELALGDRYTYRRATAATLRDALLDGTVDGIVLDAADAEARLDLLRQATKIHPGFRIILTASDEIGLPAPFRNWKSCLLLTKPFGSFKIQSMFQTLWPPPR